jgi:capsular polysaccharide biosynthesis protein
VAACTALGVVGPLVFNALVTPTYRATATLFVSIRIEEPGSAYQAGMFTQQRVRSYADIVDAPSVMATVIDRLDLSESPDELAEAVSAEATIDTVLLRVSAEHPVPALARDIANEVASVFGTEVLRLETLAGNDASPIAASLVAPATLPTSPLQPGLLLTLAAGILLGALIGVGAAVLTDGLDRTVKAGEVEERLGVPVLARIARVPGGRTGGVELLARPGGPQAEEYRMLRTLLQTGVSGRPPRSLVITSTRPGDGATQTAMNLAVALAQAGDSVVVVSADLHGPGIGATLGVGESPGLVGVAAGRASVQDALRVWSRAWPSLRVLPSGAATGADVLAPEDLSRVLRDLERLARFVIVDAPPLTSADAAALSSVASGVLLVLRHDRTRYDAAADALQRLAWVGAQVEGVVVTMTPGTGPDVSPLRRSRSRPIGPPSSTATDATGIAEARTTADEVPGSPTRADDRYVLP